MKRKSPRIHPEVLALPQEQDTWYLILRQTQTASGETAPYLLLLADVEGSKLLDSQPFYTPPTGEDILDFLAENMIYPLSSPRPHRPAAVEFETKKMYALLAPSLAQAGIAASTIARHELADQVFIQGLMDYEKPQPSVLGLLEIEGISVESAAHFYAVAADFYRQAVWDRLDDTQPLALHVEPPGKDLYVILMGKAGIQYGLLFFDSWQELVQVAAQTTQPLEILPEQGLKMLSYEPPEAVPSADLEAIQQFGWPVAHQQAYPVPVIYTQDEILRPSPEQLNRLGACLQAIARFVSGLAPDEEAEDYTPATAEYTIPTPLGELCVQVRYPASKDTDRLAGDFAQDDPQEIAQEALALDQDGELATPEGQHMLHWLRLPDDPRVKIALELSRRSWETDDPEERVLLAKEALDYFDGCIRALVVLGEEAESVEEALAYFERGMHAGEKYLAPELFEQHSGHLWDLPVARPYLVARQGVAECLVEMEAYDQALGHYRELLHLNPADHQGARYALLYIYMKLGQDEEAAGLLERYADEEYAGWPYTRALLAFRKSGDSPQACSALKVALQCNALAPEYLTGRRLLPDIDAEDTDLDEDGEARHYASDYFYAWWQTKGAIAWLRKHTE